MLHQQPKTMEKRPKLDSATIWVLCLMCLLLCPVALLCLPIAESPETEGSYIGVEFGAMHSRVAMIRDGEVDILPKDLTKRFSPSYIAFTDDGTLFGEAAEKHSALDPRNTVFGIRYLIGRKFSEVESRVEHLPFKVISNADRPLIVIDLASGRRYYTPEDLYGLILKKTKETAEEYLGSRISNAVMTIPTSFGDDQREATRDVAAQAGLHIDRLILEPVAAGISHETGHSDDERIHLIYCLNDDALSLHIVESDQGVWEMLATVNDISLAGDADGVEPKHFRHESNGDQSKLGSMENPVDFSVLNTVSTTDAIFHNSLPSIEQVLKSLKLKRGEVDDLILVGTSIHIPKLQPLLEDYLGVKARNGTEPSDAYVVGATVQARVILSEEISGCCGLLMDISSLSLGIETAEGTVTNLIRRNTPIPTRKSKVFATATNNQTSMTLRVYQGERTLAKDNVFLGEIEFSVSPSSRGVPAVKVAFEIDPNYVLRVVAQDIKTGRQEVFHILDLLGWEDPDHIEFLVLQAEEHHKGDTALRQLLPETNAVF
ncbi:heat shock protein 70 family [Dactylonectria estremocensis]|uniref:non-chaperonin molecular chaperone ATPase n=1 Tax=Dactylonectria estremocensis TaxID=1079267 RepID=A0A9P9EMH2_9HYPO|nr:heat shock protein 70 family [Dactylonectria estremocensis]